MVMKRGRQGEWPRIQREPDAWTVSPDTLLKSERSLAGPLRSGTVPNVGPRGLSAGGESRRSDYGMDRVSPREFDPMGTSSSRRDQRRWPSELIVAEKRDRGR